MSLSATTTSSTLISHYMKQSLHSLQDRLNCWCLALTEVRRLLRNNLPCEVKRVVGADVILFCLCDHCHLKGNSTIKHKDATGLLIYCNKPGSVFPSYYTLINQRVMLTVKYWMYAWVRRILFLWTLLLVKCIYTTYRYIDIVFVLLLILSHLPFFPLL